MSGLFRRNRGSRAAADESREAALEERPGATGDVPAPNLPAGVDPGEYLGQRPSTRRRGRLRKRMRHLRRVRELLLRDLGGLVYELQRAGGASADADRLVAEKIARLQLLDSEVRDLEERLDDRTGERLLREPGIGGFCAACGELYGSDARYCSTCGAPVSGDERDAPAAGGPAGAGAARGGPERALAEGERPAMAAQQPTVEAAAAPPGAGRTPDGAEQPTVEAAAPGAPDTGPADTRVPAEAKPK